MLYMIYYPEDRKYVELDVDMPNHLPPRHVKTPVKSEEWKLSITLSWVVLLHMCVHPLFIPSRLVCCVSASARVRRDVHLKRVGAALSLLYTAGVFQGEARLTALFS